MTDYQHLKLLFEKFGIGFSEEPIPDKPGMALKCVRGMDKVEGYWEFFAVFEFTPEGEFITMGVWE